MSKRINGKRLRPPYTIWVAYDPQGKPRRAYLTQPNIEVLAWIYSEDDPERSGLSITTPTDTIAAEAAGYRLRCHSVLSHTTAKLRNGKLIFT